MPAYSGAGRILGHHDLLKRVGGHLADPTGDFGQRPHIIRNAGVGTRFLACEDIFGPEGIYPAIGQVAVEFESLQGEFFKPSDETLFLGGRKNLRNIAETVG